MDVSRLHGRRKKRDCQQWQQEIQESSAGALPEIPERARSASEASPAAPRAASWSRKSGRLTLFAEIINVLKHENVRQDSAVFSYLSYVEEPFEEMFGLVPAVGILVEF